MPAGFWLRAFALLLDLSLLSLLGYGALLGAKAAGMNANFITEQIIKLRSVEAIMSALSVFWILCAFGPVLFYMFWFALWESSPLYATPGKAAFGLKVTDYSRKSIIFSRALKRNFYKSLSFFIVLGGSITVLSVAAVVPVLLVFLPMVMLGLGLIAAAVLIIGHLAAAFTNDKQALHDSLSDSLVLKNVDVSVLRRFAMLLLTLGLLWLVAEIERREKAGEKDEPPKEESSEGFSLPLDTIKSWFSSGRSGKDKRGGSSGRGERDVIRNRGTSNPLSGSKWRYIRPDDAKREGLDNDAKWWYSDKENPAADNE